MYQQMIFVNLAVNDLEASKKFFTELGFALNEQFSDDSTASVVISDAIVLMIMKKDRFGQFTKKQIADSSQTVEALLALSAESREKVDELVDKAIASGVPRRRDPGAGRLHVRPGLLRPGRPPLRSRLDGPVGHRGLSSRPGRTSRS